MGFPQIALGQYGANRVRLINSALRRKNDKRVNRLGVTPADRKQVPSFWADSNPG